MLHQSQDQQFIFLAAKNIYSNMLKNNFNMGSAVQVQKGTGAIGELTDVQIDLVH